MSQPKQCTETLIRQETPKPCLSEKREKSNSLLIDDTEDPFGFTVAEKRIKMKKKQISQISETLITPPLNELIVHLKIPSPMQDQNEISCEGVSFRPSNTESNDEAPLLRKRENQRHTTNKKCSREPFVEIIVKASGNNRKRNQKRRTRGKQALKIKMKGEKVEQSLYFSEIDKFKLAEEYVY
ncbi:hypothetical protein K493DRAFT_346090 [Basidiobolus meristosporus CBS 931.73]|uniref:Uncharacterized protein n=1 Tax=Basidiobolus meristosporus CBS 931.73 TaxID=1314790 RepID=A0A1Y1Z112_9FUNG|nr:hypothetical protein K493DRAFT_346090 [Basidiobolus meristosporus CBS 931.73]|eukprot:ORY03505.1 hypothetical protein K493DRAFT_346090 [Basidiobolus meristosporus CBS 931.73]